MCGLFPRELKNCMLPRLLKCFSHARNHAAVAVTQAALPCCLKFQEQRADRVRLLRRRAPVGSGGYWPGQTEGWRSTRQQRDMRLRYCSTSGTRHCGEPLCSRNGCSSRSVALARSRGSRVSMRSRKSFRTGEI